MAGGMSDIRVQVATAKDYPRDIERFRNNAMAMATSSEEVAGSCFYNLPRGDGVEGPSVRLAEIIMSCYGNARAGARVTEIGEKTVTAQAVFVDLENNTSVTFEVSRNILTREGRRYSDDMITVTGNAACGIAFRNAVFKGIPAALWEPIYKAARTASIGKDRPIEEVRRGILRHFAGMGKREADVLRLLGLGSVDEIGRDELVELKGVASAIKNGDCTIEEAFNGEGGMTAADLNAQLRQKRNSK